MICLVQICIFYNANDMHSTDIQSNMWRLIRVMATKNICSNMLATNYVVSSSSSYFFLIEKDQDPRHPLDKHACTFYIRTQWNPKITHWSLHFADRTPKNSISKYRASEAHAIFNSTWSSILPNNSREPSDANFMVCILFVVVLEHISLIKTVCQKENLISK